MLVLSCNTKFHQHPYIKHSDSLAYKYNLPIMTFLKMKYDKGEMKHK
jgi:hypothetical protein